MFGSEGHDRKSAKKMGENIGTTICGSKRNDITREDSIQKANNSTITWKNICLPTYLDRRVACEMTLKKLLSGDDGLRLQWSSWCVLKSSHDEKGQNETMARRHELSSQLLAAPRLDLVRKRFHSVENQRLEQRPVHQTLPHHLRRAIRSLTELARRKKRLKVIHLWVGKRLLALCARLNLHCPRTCCTGRRRPYSRTRLVWLPCFFYHAHTHSRLSLLVQQKLMKELISQTRTFQIVILRGRRRWRQTSIVKRNNTARRLTGIGWWRVASLVCEPDAIRIHTPHVGLTATDSSTNTRRTHSNQLAYATSHNCRFPHSFCRSSEEINRLLRVPMQRYIPWCIFWRYFLR